MNAAVGTVPSPGIGDHAASPQDESGALLAELLDSHHLWLPCTFSDCHEGPSRDLRSKAQWCSVQD